MQIKYLLHKHPLTLCKNIDGELTCPGCGDHSFGESYSCSKCQFYPNICFACNDKPLGSFYFCQHCWPNSPLIHRSCAELPEEIEITFHPYCILYFKKESSSSNMLDCYICNQKSGYNMYCCKDSSFQIDVKCALMLIENHEGRERINHFSHQHHLNLFEVDDASCELCHKNICGPTYACASCGFFIHKSCGELKQVLRHPFHPRHYLTLLDKPSEVFQCEACRFYIDQGLHYRCDKCNITFHASCVSLTPNIKCKAHEHILTLIENMCYKSACQACGLEIMGAFFARCVECRLNFHVDCSPLQLPATVLHKHHNHPLSLETQTIFGDILHCDVCNEKRDPEHPFYTCVNCEYRTHIRCVVTEVQHKEREKLRHFSHHHFLFLQGNKRNDNKYCYACEKGFSADPAYGCDLCKFYLHKSCAELPREKQHPFHPHPLTLHETYSKGSRKCNACHKYCHRFTYSCDDCRFHLDLDCASLKPSIKIQGHKHILTFFEKLHNAPECIRCKLTPPDASYLRCLKCDFNVHLLCSPLPQTIKHRSHECSLNLMDSLLVDYYDKQVCDVCEEERDPQECVYFCAECNFVAEFNCAFSEVMLLLERNRGDVLLRKVNKELTDKVIGNVNKELTDKVIGKGLGLTYNDIVKSYSMEENSKMNGFIWKIRRKLGSISLPSPREGNVSISRSFPYSDDDILWFMATLYDKLRKTQLTEPKDVEAEVVNVGDYIIVPNLVPILKNLLDNYGDISGYCTLTPKLKMYPLSVFCSTVESMSSTKVMDITNELMLTWWCSLEFVRKVGFEIDFVFDHLKRIVHARYGTDIDNYKSSPVYKLHEQMAQLSKEIDELGAEINKRREKMDELRKQTADIISSNRSERSRLEAKHLSEALEFRRKNAATGLL